MSGFPTLETALAKPPKSNGYLYLAAGHRGTVDGSTQFLNGLSKMPIFHIGT